MLCDAEPHLALGLQDRVELVRHDLADARADRLVAPPARPPVGHENLAIWDTPSEHGV